jgi:tRNA modification GTPase
MQFARAASLLVQTKADLAPGKIGDLAVSAHTGIGIAELLAALDEAAFPPRSSEASGTLALNARHMAELNEAVAALGRARESFERGPEFVAFELRIALDHLGKILGTVSPDDVLGKIFSSFCIGK